MMDAEIRCNETMLFTLWLGPEVTAPREQNGTGATKTNLRRI